jgi:hypothetical protein
MGMDFTYTMSSPFYILIHSLGCVALPTTLQASHQEQSSWSDAFLSIHAGMALMEFHEATVSSEV